jgi:L,D-peptidoglycan transpeptidase YkuD (ErfK/YbiS/YcfS/YnhG family)
VKLALAVALVACRGGDSATVTPPVVVVARVDAATSPIASHQLLTAIVPDWTATTAELQLWQRDGAAWHAVGDAWPAVIGNAGAAWGVGLHGTGAPAGRPGPLKHEGDGKSPAGAFSVRGLYGYAAAPPTGTRLAYTPLAEPWRCVDDPASPHYDEILDQRGVTIDWKSAEHMRRHDALYTWVVDLGHNPARTPGDGSCIFLHVWSGADGTTVGCTAMDEAHLVALIARLEPAATYVLLPRAEYDALAAAWSLPPPSRSERLSP